MKNLTFSQITSLQKTYGADRMQELINSGSCRKIEGSVGRFAMDYLEAGVCMLPLEPRVDYYGNRVPPRNMLKQGTKGTFQNNVNFWERVFEGDLDAIEWLEETSSGVEKKRAV